MGLVPSPGSLRTPPLVKMSLILPYKKTTGNMIFFFLLGEDHSDVFPMASLMLGQRSQIFRQYLFLIPPNMFVHT